MDYEKLKISKYILAVPYSSGSEKRKILFHTLRRSLIALSERSWEKINTQHFEDVPVEILDQLVKLGFLLPKDVDERELARTHINLLKYTSTHMGMFVSMTSQCNLSCPYCYQDLRKSTNVNHDLTFEHWNRIMRLIHKRVKSKYPEKY